MTHNTEALRILRAAGDKRDDDLNLGETALALAAFEKADIDLRPYQRHLDLMAAQLREKGDLRRAEEQLDALRTIIVTLHSYSGDSAYEEDPRANNLMDVVDRRQGSPLTLGLLYLHLAAQRGWAMTGLDLCGHFLLRLSASDGYVIFDPFRAGQKCQIEEASGLFAEEDEEDEDIALLESLSETTPLDIASDLLKPLSSRALLLRLQHTVKRRLMDQNRLDSAITTIQSMILFAPREQGLWKELGYMQAERGHLRAAINALEVVKDLLADPAPLQQTDIMLRELRWRLN